MISKTEPDIHELIFRIPGVWRSADEFAELLPDDFRIQNDELIGPRGIGVELQHAPSDDLFPTIFSQACLRPPSDDEQRVLKRYRMNAVLIGPAGNTWIAQRMMEFAAAALQAGGAGVFIDNSARAHGAGDWLQLLKAVQRDDVEALLWTFVSIVSGPTEIYSVGAHVLGHSDAILQRSDDMELDAETLKCFILKSLSGISMLDQDVVVGPRRVRLQQQVPSRFPKRLPMHNPFGQWRLEVVE